MRSLLALCALLLSCLPAPATTWYVSGQGHDESSGLAPGQAFRSLQHAADQTHPGDTVLVLDGEYSLTGVVFHLWVQRYFYAGELELGRFHGDQDDHYREPRLQ